MAQTPFTCVGFDFDGTLVDSWPGIQAGFEATLARHGLSPQVPLERSLIGPPLRPTLAKLTGLTEPEALQPLVETFKVCYDGAGCLRTEPYPGVDATLRALRAAGLDLFIATNKREAPTLRILDHLDWTPLFSGIHALDTFQPPQPDKPAMVGEILRRGGWAPASTAFVGDSADDGRTAERHGLRFFAVPWGYGGFGEGPLQPGWVLLRQAEDLLAHLL